MNSAVPATLNDQGPGRALALTDGLVDELHLMIGPVALGAGTALFIGQPEVSLGLIDGPRTWNGSGNVLVRYEVRDRASKPERVALPAS
jgi:hypothetical protein